MLYSEWSLISYFARLELHRKISSNLQVRKN